MTFVFLFAHRVGHEGLTHKPKLKFNILMDFECLKKNIWLVN